MPDFRNQANEPTGVIYGVLNMLRHIQQAYPSDYSVCVFDAKGKTFRNDIFSEYKANRPKMPDELACQIEPLKNAIKAMGWFMITEEGVEADDVIGSLSKKANKENIFAFTRTSDKDKILAIFNLSDQSLVFELTGESLQGSYKNYFTGKLESFVSKETFKLNPWEYRIYTK